MRWAVSRRPSLHEFSLSQSFYFLRVCSVYYYFSQILLNKLKVMEKKGIWKQKKNKEISLNPFLLFFDLSQKSLVQSYFRVRR